MAFMDRIEACNNATLSNYRPFYGRGARIGWIREDRIEPLTAFPGVFSVAPRRIDLSLTLYDYDTATTAVAETLEVLVQDGWIPSWRGERYAVATTFGAPPLMSIERAACPYFGIRSWGVHINGYVRKGDDIHLWIGERSADKPTYPGMLDNTVAGGQPEGLTLMENLIKECDEEASIPEELARNAVSVGAITYRYETESGLKPDEMFCYDLELPDGFSPTPNDGEVAAFHLMPVDEVFEIVRDTERFKYNCSVALIHFFLRHGYITPDNEPDFDDLCAGLNHGDRSEP